MKAVKERTATFADAPETVHNALLGVIQNGKYELVGVQNEQHRFLFSAGMSALSWGTTFLAEVTSTGPESQLSVTCGGRDEAPSALLDGWKHGKAADKVVGEVRATLEVGAAPAAPVESFVSLPDGSTQPWTTGEWPFE
ncbi:hypothetical protein GCM10023169_02570 [Georgenia halophila]|uniref:Uncharacterized protein n=1 Tax=Georgenia halophila TaxID=620889 RepID=A0ABP8KU42_9MICO